MSKELIENLLIEFDEMGFEPTILCDSQREVDSFRNRLKQVLDYLKAIDNANPSEALNYLNQFINETTKCLENPKQYAKDYDKEIFYKYKYTFETTIKQALLKAQEQEKVLEIIKKKYVEVGTLITLIKVHPKRALDLYNESLGFNVRKWLKQEEFDLLKRWVDE